METSRESSMDQAFIRKITDTVLGNLENEQFGVEELADNTGISRSHLHRKIKLLKGKSVSEFIREIRLEEAMKLLRNDVATASEIAYRVGFSSPSYFYKSFQKFYGFPPGEVKKLGSEQNVPQKEENDQSHADYIVNEKKDHVRENARLTDGKGSFVKIAVAITLAICLGLVVFFTFRKENAPSNDGKSIAVLPFANLSSHQENQYFADGIVEDLLNRLSRIEDFKVISRTSSEMYREKGSKSIPQIAQELGVMYIIEGSVQRYADKVRVNVQLIDANTDDHVWSKLFDRNLNDIFETQSEIAVQVATEMNTILTNQQTTALGRNRTHNVKAFELYQLGRFYWNKRTVEGYNTSLEYFKQAIAEDPEYGLAYAGMADTYNLMAIQGYIDKQEGRDKTVELALKALELDETLAEAHNVLGSIYTYVDWNWEEAEKRYLRAIELNPNYSTAHHYYSEHLSITGRHEQARQHIDKALELDPLSFVIRYVSVKLYYGRGLFKEALADNQKSHELNPGHPWSAEHDFEINYFLGNQQKAYEGFKNYYRIAGYKNPEKLDSIYQVSGNEGLLKWIIEISDNNYNKAEFYALLGEEEKAMDYLEISVDNKSASPEFAFKYMFKNMHSNPRFIALLERAGITRFQRSLQEITN